MKVYEYLIRVKQQGEDKLRSLMGTSHAAKSSLEQLANTTNKTNSGFFNFDRVLKTASSTMTGIRGRLASFTQGMTNASRSVASFAKTSFNSAIGGLKSFGGGLKNVTSELIGMVGLSSSVMRFLGPAALAASLAYTGSQAVMLAADLEQTQVGFEVMLGSAEKATKMISNLRQFAKVTPFETTDLVKASEILLGFGVAGEQIMPTISMLGDVARGNAEKLRLISLAYAQIQSAGRLMGQDLLQLVNAGFNPLQEISKKTGRSMRDLKKDMENGQISAAMVTDAFRSATSEGGRFYGMMEKQSKTFHGMLSTLKDEWAEILLTIGQKALPKIIAGLKWMRSLLSDITRVDFSPLILIFDHTWRLVSDVIGIFREFLEIMGVSSSQVNVLQFVFNTLAFSLRAATLPLRVLLTGFKLLVEIISKAVDTLKGFGKIMYGIHTFDFAMVREGWLETTGAIGKGFENVKNQITQFASNEAEGFKEIFNAKPKPLDPALANNSAFGLTTDAAGKDGKNELKSGIDKISGGGKQAINVTINLENLIGTQKFEVTNVKESIRDMEVAVTEALLRVLNSANYAAAQ